METVTYFIFFGSKITADGDWSHEIKSHLLLGRKAMTNLDSMLKSRHFFTNKCPSSQRYAFTSSLVWMWELDHKERWVLKNWCFWTVVLDKTAENLSDSKIIPVNPKGNQFWLFFERTDTEVGTPILCTWCEELTHWKRPWCWERLKAGGEWDDRGWNGCMVSPTRWTRVWASSGCLWWPGKSGMLQYVGSQRVRHDWETKLNSI